MRISVRRRGLTLLAGYRDWVSALLCQSAVLSQPALNMRGPRSVGIGAS